jgi:hypothetical protein
MLRLRFTILLVLLCCQSAFANAPSLQWIIRGVNGDILQNTQNMLAAEEKLLATPLTAANIKQFTSNLPRIINKALEPYGYFFADIKIKLMQQNQQWLMHI